MNEEKKARSQRKAEIVELEKRRKQMRFTGRQRLILLNMMPKEGGYFNIKKMREVKEALGFNDQEQTMFESSTALIPGGTVTNWRKLNLQITSKSIDVGEWLTNHFRTELKKQYDEEKLREETIDLYDIFCGPPNQKQ